MLDSSALALPTPPLIRWLSRPMAWLRPNGTSSARETYQLRFLCGAVLLALGVAVVALSVAVTAEQWPGVTILVVFVGAILLQALAVRLGAPILAITWTILVTVGGLLTASALVASSNQLGQLYWFLLLPLAARALMVPRHDDNGKPPSRRLEILLAVAAFAVALGIMLSQSRLMNPAAVRSAGEAASIGLDVGLFLLSALGLLYVHDLTVRETAAELQQLRQLLSICAWCRKIQDGDGWVALEQYMGQRQRLDLSHGMCPTCFERHMPTD